MSLRSLQTAHIDVQKTVFDNGLTLLTVEAHDVPIVTATIWYRVGSANETAGQTGISHFLEHLMFKGTPTYGKGMIDFLTASNGGYNNAGTIFDYTMYYFNFSSDRWELALQIEADRMKNCLFESEEVEAERGVILEELKQQLDSPWGQLAMQLESTMFPAPHPNHHPVIGWQTDVESISRDALAQYYQTFYAPNNATLVIVGDVQTTQVIKAVHQHFGHLKPIASIPAQPLAIVKQQEEQRITLQQDSGVKRLQIGYHAVNLAHPDTYALDAIDYLLSHGKTSRLHQRLVENEQLAVFADTFYHTRKQAGVFYFTAALRRGRTPEQFERALEEEIAKLQTDLISDEELQKVKNIVAAEFVFDKETTAGLAHALGEYEMLDTYEFFSRYPQRMETLTAEDIRRAARTYFANERRTVVWGLPQDPEREEQDFDEEEASLPPMTNDMVFRTPEEQLQPPKAASNNHNHVAPEFFSADSRRFRHHRWVLPNGLTVLFLEHHLLPLVSMEAFVDAGQKYEAEEHAGITVLTGQLLEEGTTTRTAFDIASAIESVGGSLDGQSQGVSAQVLSKDIDLGMDLLSDVLMRPIFDEHQMKKKRHQILISIEEDDENPSTIAFNLFRDMVYGQHPYHRPRKGYKHSVRKLRREALVKNYQTYFRPNNTILSIVGDADPARIRETVERYFAEWQAQPIPAPLSFEIPRPTGCVRKHVAKDKEQVHVYLGHLGVTRTNPDFYPLFVMDHILGVGPGFTDRISRKLRDEMGLAYSVSANISGSAEKEPGMFLAYIGTSPENAPRAVEGFLQEIRTIRREAVSGEELELAKNYITGSYVFNFETSSQLSRYLINVERYQLGEDFIWRFPDIVDQISAEDILRVAQQYLDEENYYLASAGKAW